MISLDLLAFVLVSGFSSRVRGTNEAVGWWVIRPFLRKVKTASGATAVQIVEKQHGQRTLLEHLGSAHSEAELAALVEVGTRKLN